METRSAISTGLWRVTVVFLLGVRTTKPVCYNCSASRSVLAYAQLPGNRNLTQGIAGLISPSHYDVPQGGEDLRAKRLGLELLKIGGDCTRSHYR